MEGKKSKNHEKKFTETLLKEQLGLIERFYAAGVKKAAF